MKRVKPVALVGAGNFTDSPLTRFLRFSDQLGPVKSPSYRLASRISNIFRSGHPVKDYAALDACRLILVCVPDQTLPEILCEMAASGISWRGKAIILCSMWLDSSHLSELSARGGSIGSLSPIPGFEGLEDFRYLIEGDKLAILEAKRLLAHQKQRVIAIERSLKPFYLAALTCTGDLLFALMVAASGSLRHAGLSSPVSAAILEKQFGRALRSYLKSGRNFSPAPRDLSRQLDALSTADPMLAQYIEQSCRISSRLLAEQAPDDSATKLYARKFAADAGR
ncbi:MAG TPA: hypothetical protein VNX70_01950 [Bryobacteraceae bacterium]|nr:hypothetical protein [Bryobacteraceae bacterium]